MMMNFGYGYGPMIFGGFGGMSLIALITWLVWITVGVLLIVFLWQKINNK